MKNREEKVISDSQIATKVSVNTIVVNLALSIIKLGAGLIGRSSAMISDAIHSASDVFSTIIVMIGYRFSVKESDENHPYGHERFECVASILLAVLLFGTGLGVGYSGVMKILEGNYQVLSIPGTLALVAAVASIVIKEGMYWYTRRAAKQIDSGSLMADAWHHRSDAMSSVGSFLGILGARLGYPVFDPIASVIICLFIGKAAFDIFKDAIIKMTDESCDQETIQEMGNIILKQEGVRGLDEIKTRRFGNKIYVDIEISADGSQSLKDAHEIAEKVHLEIESNFDKVKHCMVHVNPSSKN